MYRVCCSEFVVRALKPQCIWGKCQLASDSIFSAHSPVSRSTTTRATREAQTVATLDHHQRYRGI
jgi:hypothetical protein